MRPSSSSFLARSRSSTRDTSHSQPAIRCPSTRSKAPAVVCSGSRPSRSEASTGKAEDQFVQEEHAALGRDELTEIVDEQTALYVRLVPPSVEPRRRYTFEDPQLEEDLLEVRVGGIERLRAADRKVTGLHLLHVRLRRSDVPPADVVSVPVGAGTQSDIRP